MFIVVIQSAIRTAWRDSGLIVRAALVAVLVLLLFEAGLMTSTAMMRVSVDPAVQIVNRAKKGNLQLDAPKHHQHDVTKQLWLVDDELGLPEGCDALVSPFAEDNSLAKIAGRCVA